MATGYADSGDWVFSTSAYDLGIDLASEAEQKGDLCLCTKHLWS